MNRLQFVSLPEATIAEIFVSTMGVFGNATGVGVTTMGPKATTMGPNASWWSHDGIELMRPD